MANPGDGSSGDGKKPVAPAAATSGFRVAIKPGGLKPPPQGLPVRPPVVAPPQYGVSGRVTRTPGAAGAKDASGVPVVAPMTNVVVRAFDRELRRETPLGESRTDAAGNYSLTYTRAQLATADKTNADLVVRVFDASGHLLIASPVIFRARQKETVDLVYKDPAVAPPAEIERHLAVVAPALAGAPLATLTDDEILFTASKSGVPALYVGYLAVANRLATQTKIPGEVFYALFRAGLPTQLPALLVQPASRIRAALQSAVDRGIASARVGANIDATLASLRALIATYVLGDAARANYSLGPVLAASGVTAAQQAKFVARYADFTGDDAAFWAALRADATFGPVATDALELAVGAGILSRDNPALVTAIVARHRQGKTKSLRDLVGLGLADWEAMIRSTRTATGIPFPSEITGDSEEHRVAAYAADLQETMRAAYPSLAAGLHLAAGSSLEPAERTDLGRFFANAGDFVFEDTRVRDYIANNRTTALAGVADEAKLATNLERVQRLYRIAPRGEHIDALLKAGLDSAHAISAIPADTFRRDFSGAFGGDDKVMMAYNKSGQITSTNKAIGLGYYQWAQNAKSSGINQPPDLQTLFGSLDSCDCSECQSVYGAASYLVDVLQYLRNSSSAPFDELMKRRPDLQYIDLTCENTDTPLPLVDLSNEILEYYVIHPDFSSLTDHGKELAKNTTSDITADELSLNPQYSYDDAYTTLKTALRAPKLPFDRWLTTIRAYLALLGTSRYELLTTLRTTQITADDVAREALGLSLEQWNILVGASPAANDICELFGFAPGTADATWRDQACVVDTLLERLDIAYDDLVALVGTLYVNPSLRTNTVGPQTIVLFSDQDTCDLTTTYVQFQSTVHTQNATTGLQAADWQRLAQFLRLWRALGWTIPEVDRALTALGATTIGEPQLVSLGAIQQLRTSLDLPVTELLALWAPIDTFGSASLYANLFQNRAVLNPVDTAFALAGSGTELQVTTQLIADHQAAVLAGLKIGGDDLARLTAAVGATTLTLGNLSALYRRAVLAQALDLSISDLLALVAFVKPSFDPFTDATSTQLFVDVAKAVADTELSVAQLAYAFQGSDPSGTLTPLTATITALLDDLQGALRKIVDDNQVQPDPNGALLRAKLGMAIDATRVDQAMDVIDDQPTSDPAGFIAANLSFLSAATQAVLLDPAQTDPQARRARVFPELLAHVRATQSRGAVNEALADALGIASDIVSYMLEVAPGLSNTPAPKMSDFLALVGDGLAASYYNTATFDSATPPTLTRTDAEASFYWGQTSPDPALQMTGFGARWKGYVVPLHSETYTFYVTGTDGARLWITSDLSDPDPTTKAPLVDHWSDTSEGSGTFAMVAGQAYQIVVDYHYGHPVTDPSPPDSTIQLAWSSLSTSKGVVPQSSLYTKPAVAPATLAPGYLSLHRLSVIVAGLNLTATELSYINAHRADFAFDPTQMGTIAQPWPVWDALRAYATLRDRLPVVDKTLLDVFGATAQADAVTTLAAIAGWDVADAQTVIAQLAIPATSFQNASGPTRLRDVFLLAQRIGITVGHLLDWTTKAPDATQAEDMIQAAKGRYDDAGWATAAKPINDILRNARRDALIAYALSDPAMATRNVIDANSLFEYFLIDVNMDACMMTSRIKQAISSAQLWVQRCLMNLEPSVSPSLLDANRWSWMKNYRVWEANRKVFLYPENWMDPTLRDDKTPFFEELEAQLLQGELSVDNIEAALTDYLHKVDAVARLDLCGVYRQEAESGDAGDTIHLIGRTQNTPAVYYYRQLATASETWTPWQEVPLDIDGDHVIPCMWERRLYLFWTTFEQKPDAEQDLSGPSMDTSAHQKWEVADAKYTEYKKGLKLYDNSSTFFEEWATGGSDEDPSNNPPQYPNPGDWFRATYEDNTSPIGDIGNTQGQIVQQGQLPDPGDPGSEPAKTDNSASGPSQHWEIKLSWAEYKDGVWSSKQSCDTPLESYSHGSYDPTSEDHFFRASTGDHLEVSCYRRRQLDTDVPWADEAWKIGHFTLDDCHAQMLVTQLDAQGSTPGQETIITPIGSQLSYMGYREQSGEGELVLMSQTSLLDTFELLRDTPYTYDVVPPCEPGTSTDGEIAYPFVFQDRRRAYVTAPVWLPVPVSPAKSPKPPIKSGYAFALDPTIVKIININTGDPGPEETGSPSESIVVTGTGVDSTFVSGVKSTIVVPSELATSARSEMVTYALVKQGGSSAIDKNASGAPPMVVQLEQRYTRFLNSFHPFVCSLITALNKDGVDGVFTLANQQQTNDTSKKTKFESEYNPNNLLVDASDYPLENVDFGPADYAPGGAYAIYNWELFFHVPLLIATSLMNDQQYETAQKWFHYIFDPTQPGDKVSSYWRFLPFTRDDAKGEQIVNLLESLAPGGDAKLRQTVLDAIDQWRDNPFEPFEIARLRISAFEKTVVIKYIQNLIAWGDQLFAQDTIEDINEATQLYVLAAHILGKRPQKSPARGEPDAQSYHDLQPHLDGFSNAWVTLENQFPFSAIEGSEVTTSVDLGMGSAPGFYFCIPSNDDLLTLWDTVDDRLFKVRNCMNIGGVVRQLPLFEPPIDPALLVQAKAMGLDLSTVLSDINSPQGPYRFTSLVQKAMELCNEVKGLGSALLAALEKNDAEQLALLRADQEVSLFKAIKDVKQKQLDEANANIVSLQATRDLSVQKQTYYQGLVDTGLISSELTQLAQLTVANQKAQEAVGYEISAQNAAQIPNATAGASGWSSPVVTAQFGGSNISGALSSMARYVGGQGATASYVANMSSIMAGHTRRDQEWNQQLTLATKELDQIDKQIAAAQIRVAVAQKELDNQQLQIDHSQAVDDFLRSKKYTNQQLYSWMVSKLAGVYFQAYNTAYDLAKKAEKAYRYELGLDTSSFINFGYWDSTRKGLYAGDQLAFDLKRMEASYLDQNRRELELSKDISLATFAPMNLIELRQQGTTAIDLPELVFDMDYPGHYMRRLRTVSLTIPCVVGPYTTVNCTLTLVKSKLRTDPTAQRPYPEDTTNPDPRIKTTYGAQQSIATSHAQADGGVFEVNFRDERYLPFEGAGAVSTWQLSLPADCNAFDLSTISDVILSLKYTARDGGALLAAAARKARTDSLKGPAQGTAPLARWFSARHEFPNDWHRFLYPEDAADTLALALDFGETRFPYQFRAAADPQKQKKIRITSLDVFAVLAEGYAYTPFTPDAANPANPVGNFMFSLTPPTGTGLTLQVSSLQWGLARGAGGVQSGTGTWQLAMTADMLTSLLAHQPTLCKKVTVDGAPHIHLDPAAFDDLWIVCHYDYK